MIDLGHTPREILNLLNALYKVAKGKERDFLKSIITDNCDYRLKGIGLLEAKVLFLLIDEIEKQRIALENSTPITEPEPHTKYWHKPDYPEGFGFPPFEPEIVTAIATSGQYTWVQAKGIGLFNALTRDLSPITE